MDNTEEVCLSCARSQAEVPLVSLRYRGQSRWICPDCLPTLIHRREQLQAKLEAAPAAPAGD